MAHEHWNDVPGDIAGESADNLPGGFGTDNPDLSPEATIDELIDNDVINAYGEGIARADQQGGITSGTGYAVAGNSGATVNPDALVTGEEAHPGAGVGFSGEERDKRVEAQTAQPEESGEFPLGGTPDEARTHQQQESLSVETEGPVGGQGATGENQASSGDKAA